MDVYIKAHTLTFNSLTQVVQPSWCFAVVFSQKWKWQADSSHFTPLTHTHMRIHTHTDTGKCCTRVPTFEFSVPVPVRTLRPMVVRTKSLSHIHTLMQRWWWSFPGGHRELYCRGKSRSQLKTYWDKKEGEREWSRQGGRGRERGRDGRGWSWNVNLMGKVLRGREIEIDWTEGALTREAKRLILRWQRGLT